MEEKMKTQDLLVYILVAGAALFLAIKYLKPVFAGKKKDNCDTDCNCK